MIRKISADRQSFKTLEFGPGLNILLADKHAGASERDSRNGAGKTSFVELVHFLFGASAPPASIFRKALGDWKFRAEVRIGGEDGTVVRSGSQSRLVQVAGALAGTISSPQLFAGGPPQVSIPVDAWNASLGERLFGLERDTEDGGERFRPSFRSLFSYFARRVATGGFQSPMSHFAKQQPWDCQVSLSWLLGLDWTISQRFQELREREKGTKGLKAAVESGELARFAGGPGELRTELTLTRARAREIKERLEAFRVLPDYKELEQEATRITGTIADLNGGNVADRALLRDLEASLQEEHEPGKTDVRKVYEEAGVVLPGLARRRFDEVEHFHRRVLENRRAHLKGELDSAKARIAGRDQTNGELDRRRQQIMGILKAGGALSAYTALREEAGREEARVEALGERLRDVERLATLRTELKGERARLTRSLQEDRRERDEIVQKAILRFEDLSKSLYERAGSLTVGPGSGGPEFKVKIPSGQSKGIANMQIFCFDLMLMELQAERGTSPGFLIHDSHLFDGVDERQVARALQLGAQRAQAGCFQYIVTMNTDALPHEGFDAAFAVEDYFMDVRLTDAEEHGGLFGVRFD